MATVPEVKNIFKETQKDYDELWECLTVFKGDMTDQKMASIIKFQYILGKRLMSLQALHDSIKKRESQLVARKESFSSAWFRKEMKRMGCHRLAIRKLSYVGRTMGDVFAYFFCRHEPDFLESQLLHEEISSFPTRDGGLGEIEFIRSPMHFANHLTIYHGITNILRKGDVSFFNLKDKKVSAVGEIKTERKGASELSITVTTIGKRENTSFLRNIPIEKKKTLNRSRNQKFDQSRFQRQIKSISEIFIGDVKDTETERILEKYHHKELQDFIKESKCNVINHKKVDSGLMYISTRDRSSLFSRFHDKPDFKKDDAFIENVQSLFIKGHQHNEIVFGSFLFDKEDKPITALGYAPLFYSTIKIEHLKKLYFCEVSVMTVYNPAFLVDKLKSIGFAVEETDDTIEFVAKFEGVQMRLPTWSMRFFINLIINNVYTEDGIVEVINRLLIHLKGKKITQTTRVDIKMTQFM
jgi:hypothetical protein